VLAAVLRGFQAQFPSVALRLAVEALGAIAARVLDRSADLGIGGPVIDEHPGLERQAIGAVELIPVAAPEHPLAMMTPIPPGEARRHLQLVLSDRSALTSGREFSVLGTRDWRLADLGAKHVLLREGLGWGNMPLPMVAGDLVAGTLVRLVVPENPQTPYPLSALWRRDTRLGPAAQWALAAFEAKLGACPPPGAG
jgi:DNA-binding transcriptional LysR family regulator